MLKHVWKLLVTVLVLCSLKKLQKIYRGDFKISSWLVIFVIFTIFRLVTELEKMKFLCKEFWSAIFGRQVDNLRTNHQVLLTNFLSVEIYRFECFLLVYHVFFQGIYIVQDNKFFVLANFVEGKQHVKESAIYLAVPCGIIRFVMILFFWKLSILMISVTFLILPLYYFKGCPVQSRYHIVSYIISRKCACCKISCAYATEELIFEIIFVITSSLLWTFWKKLLILYGEWW